VRLIGGAALLCWLLGFVWARLRPVQRRAGYVALAIALATGIVGGLKAVTNVDCPWDYVEYGGERPRVRLFEDRPDSWPRAKCFPGAHSSSGFALLAFYFALRDSRKRLARVALAAGLVVGATFSVGQEARGAHFVSHDLTSAILVWLTLLGLYAWLLKGVTTRGAAAASPGSHP
jgi:membrane-associated PAP2 superfamily phosphatase